MHQHHLKRHLLNRAAAWSVEQLEQRTLLTAGAFDISRVPTYVPTSSDINDTKHGPLGNFGSNLVNVYTEFKKFVRKGGEPAEFSSKTQSGLEYSGSRVAVTLRTRGSVNALADRLHAFGAELIFRSGVYHTVDAWVPIAQLSSVARDSTVLNASPAVRPNNNFRGIADNQADIAQNSDSARSTFGVDGTGIKVGVISDSVNQFEGGLADSVTTRDLPKGVEVIDDSGFGVAGTDEGRAMLELIHDIAPGASLAFATAGPTQFTMAHNIVELVRAGCNVIVDDVSFANEPFFQESLISQAITDAVENHGVTYLSSAANSGENGFQTSGRWVTDINGRTLLDFDPSEGVDTRNRVTIAGGGLLTLQYDDPFNGVVGGATVDLDISLINTVTGNTTFIGNTANLLTTNPIELVPVFAGTYDIEISVADKLEGATLPTTIRVNLQQTAAFTSIEYSSTVQTVIGHNGGQNTISVGAVPFFLAPPFNNSQSVTSETFSANGPVTFLFKGNGSRRSKPLTLLKPDISGIDGVNTSFFGTDSNKDKDRLPNFFGTSAAAPNVAAVVALMRELNPDATPSDIRNALIASAKESPVNNQKKGEFDPQSGFGLIDSLLALHQILPQTVVADIGRVIPDSLSRGVSEATIRFSDPVAGFDINNLTLVRGSDSDVNLLTDTNVTLESEDNQTFVLGGLKAITSKRGTYFLRFNPAGVVDRKTKTLPALNGSTSFFVNGKPTGLVAIPVSANEIDLSFTDNTSNEAGFLITRAIDSSFTKRVITFRTKANVTHFKDIGLSATSQYFYNVRAIVNDGAPNPTTETASAFTLAANEVIVDNRSEGAVIKGGWTLTSDSEAAIGGDYLNATPKGIKSVTFTPELDAAGTYFIYVRSIKGKGNATNTPVALLDDGSAKKTFSINQRDNSGWILLGTFKLPKGNATSVRISNTGANGTVIADSVRFLRNSSAASGIKVTASANASSLFSAEEIKKDEDSVLG